jgi:hypothetical protein
MKTEVRISVHDGSIVSSYLRVVDAIGAVCNLVHCGISARIMFSVYSREAIGGPLSWISDHETREEAEEAAGCLSLCDKEDTK